MPRVGKRNASKNTSRNASRRRPSILKKKISKRNLSLKRSKESLEQDIFFSSDDKECVCNDCFGSCLFK